MIPGGGPPLRSGGAARPRRGVSITNALLYVLTVFFWGTSWLAIKFQLGVVMVLIGNALILTRGSVLGRRLAGRARV